MGEIKPSKLPVSILALPFGRALRRRERGTQSIIRFQSSPSLSEGRYRMAYGNHDPMQQFQSSPSLSEGRYGPPPLSLPSITCFNPRPPFRKGATHPPRATWSHTPCFNPRPPFRKGATRRRTAPGHRRRCFNPRPPFRKGATVPQDRVRDHVLVSILALPFGRALQAGCDDDDHCSAFQSSPSLSEGRYEVACHLVRALVGFNPRPPFRKGATRPDGRVCAQPGGFNPRPPFRKGATW